MKFWMGGQQAFSSPICCSNQGQLWSQVRLLRALCSCILKTFSESLILCWAVLMNLNLNILKSALMESSFSRMLTYCGKSIHFLVIRLHHLAAGVAQTVRGRSLCVEIKHLICGIGHNWTVSWTHPGIPLPRVLTAVPSAGLTETPWDALLLISCNLPACGYTWSLQFMCNKMLLIVSTISKTASKYPIKELSYVTISSSVGIYSIGCLHLLPTYSLTDPAARISVTLHPQHQSIGVSK